ncbi:MAG: HEAT repeat domain-containing protein [Planctomycetes bacterium]|nr:HEAT repeat domain-containing protein [Planctomycetota bacterium]
MRRHPERSAGRVALGLLSVWVWGDTVAAQTPEEIAARIAVVRADKDSAETSRAMNDLVAWREKAAKQVATELLGDDSRQIQAYGFTILQRMKSGAADALPRLEAHMRNSDTWQRRTAAQTALAIRKHCRLALLVLAKDPDRKLRGKAAIELGEAEDAALVPALVALVRDRHPDVRQVAARSLRGYGPAAKTAIPELLRVLCDNPREHVQPLRDDGFRVLCEIGMTLAALAPDGYGAVVGNRLTGAATDLAVELLDVVGSMDPLQAKGALPHVVQMLQHAEQRVQIAAVAALSHGAFAAEDVLSVLFARAANESLRPRVAAALGRFGAGVLPRLREVLLRGQSPQRLCVVEGIGVAAYGDDAVAHREVIKLLVLALRDAEPAVRGAALTAIGKRGKLARAAAADVLQLLADPNPDTRRCAAQALGALGSSDPFVVRTLIRSIDDKQPSVRQAAAAALGTLGIGTATAAAVAPLTQLFSSPVVADRVAAFTALIRLEADPLLRAGYFARALAGSPELVAAAEFALPKHRGLLAGLSHGANARVIARALRVLLSVPGEGAPSGDALVGLLDHVDAEVRLLGSRFLAQRAVERPKHLPPVLVRNLGAGDSALRGATALLVARYGRAATDLVPEVGRLLTSEQLDERRSAARALEILGGHAAGALPQILATLPRQDGLAARALLTALDGMRKSDVDLRVAQPILDKLAVEGPRMVRRQARDLAAFLR